MSHPVKLEFSWIQLSTTETWSRLLVKLRREEVEEKNLSRSVYVLRIGDKYAIQYPRGASPTLYIGEGHLQQRIDAHGKWLANLKGLVGEINFELGVATPRVRNNLVAYKDCEAALIQFFLKKYGSLPLRNRHKEYPRISHNYRQLDLSNAVTVGRGKRYQWAIQPMRANPFHKAYARV